ncbi:serine protease SP24D [Drosophila grimshawi]|uniref:trypsin n=1 Tax=Drosophila grimshawi TaxID=7222 RepID=B4JLU1_DROGR|nr:serine protease SP24D [Drosophila grimshawi]EDV91702.1 GH24521 [Drosophila grimshawi]
MLSSLVSVIGPIVLLAAICQAAPNPIDSRIVGGVDANKGQFPHQISLRKDGSHNCGGSIISANYVLTAAHCVTYDNGGELAIYATSQLTVRAGSNDRFQGGVLKQVAAITVHEDYGNFLNDVAVIRMETPFIFSEYIQAIGLPSKDTPAHADIIISGWGRLRQGGDLPRYLQYNTLTSQTLEECQESINYGYPNMLCLIHEADNGACNGDSGGPAHYNNEVVGIAGFVYGGCGRNNPDGYARVYYHVSWIKANTDL